MSQQRQNPFKVTRHGTPIDQYALKNAVNTGISYSLHFESWQACIAAGLDIERWENAGYPPQLMSSVVAWYRLSGLVQTHSRDAAQK